MLQECTGILNENYAAYTTRWEEDDGVYEEINGEMKQGRRVAEQAERDQKGREHQSSATFGIDKTGSIHAYVNVETPETGSDRGDWRDGAGCNNGIDGQEDEGQRRDQSYLKSQEGGRQMYDSVTIDGEESVTGNETIIPDSFAQRIHDAIAQVDTDRREGEERLEQVLKKLEEGMREELEEGEKIQEQMKQLDEDTPRRSKRIAERVAADK